MSQSLADFYNQYHQKNNPYVKIIGDGNFTYAFVLPVINGAVTDWNRTRVLDVGCGVGPLSLYCAKKGAEVVGVDISKRAVAIATGAAKHWQMKKVTFMQGDVTKMQKTLGKFDLIICNEVVEHVADDVALLKSIHSLLKPGGALMLATPSSENWLRRNHWLKKHDDEVGHLRIYSIDDIQALFTHQPWEIEQLIIKEGPVRKILFTSRLGWMIRFLKGPLVPIFHWCDDVLAKIGFGWHGWIVVARKR